MDLKCSFWSVDSPCYPVHEILNRISSVLVLGSKRGATGSKISAEAELILNRAGKFDVPEDDKRGMTVCTRHRKNLTTDWTGRKRTMCCHPSHIGTTKAGVIHKPTRRVNAKMSQGFFELHNAVVPIGSGSFYVNGLTAY